jgi:MoaA/NifB/PqqE/SkfB family radical SAM enzyme
MQSQSPTVDRVATLNLAPPRTTPRRPAWQTYTSRVPSLLPEFDKYQPQSGHPHWQRLAQEAEQEAREFLPRLDRPEGRIELYRRQLAAAATYARGYYFNKKLQRQGREDFRPFIMHWTALRSCNFSCTYCDDHQGRKYPDLPNEGVLDTEKAKKLLRIMRTRTAALYIAGGEPTIRKDLPELIRYARELKYYPIMINTNGALLHRLLRKEDWRSALADLDSVIFSLDGFDLGQLKDMWGTSKPQDVLRNLLMLRELSKPLRFQLMINTVVQPHTVDAATDVLNFANDLNIWYLPVPVNSGANIVTEIKNAPAYKQFAETVLERKKAGYRIQGSYRLNKRMLFSAPLDCRTTLKPQVDFDGTLPWPCKASVNVKPQSINVLDFESVDEIYEHARTLINPTRFHGPAQNQCGGNCNWTQYYVTDAYAHGLAHPLSMLRDVMNVMRDR